MMREKVFKFKQFEVLNDMTPMKVGTDAVLLGAWCRCDDAATVLDVGTGCGVIALMIAQRNPGATVHAIDVDAVALAEARLNFERSPWRERLRAFHGDFRDCAGLLPLPAYDLIVSNPPFFTEKVLSPSVARNVARHTASLPFGDLFRVAASLLSPHGRLAMVTPASCEREIEECATFASLYPSRIVQVSAAPGTPPKRLLWEFTRSWGVTQRSALAIRDATSAPSREYARLTEDFYLDSGC